MYSWGSQAFQLHVPRLLESNALPGKESLPYLEHNAYLHQIVYWRRRWDTMDAAVESVHSGEFPLHYNVDSLCASENLT
jgi:hypothetical protein